MQQTEDIITFTEKEEKDMWKSSSLIRFLNPLNVTFSNSLTQEITISI